MPRCTLLLEAPRSSIEVARLPCLPTCGMELSRIPITLFTYTRIVFCHLAASQQHDIRSKLLSASQRAEEASVNAGRSPCPRANKEMKKSWLPRQS
ncbi:hypothetical protein M404DRAFT_998665 [Pisolithus tinctorius Marx 270]|uniref:Uncharacterized protein n=1 Tax=Pisolithus tinctorius Marx 270 TaxID=870435 RepID=A0A0C3PF64_PISTI|nr:hypothetical protein M404DRAFT_998665 [Pisolithus tinctorius Marx 270]